MSFVIGMDEAGYGPNLGPLVVTATVWEVSGNPREMTFWNEFEGIITQHPPRAVDQIQIADSKRVHDPSKGVGPLERGVLAAWSLHRQLPQQFTGWLSELLGNVSWNDWDQNRYREPWFATADLGLPQVSHSAEVQRCGQRWLARAQDVGIQLRAIRSDMVLTRRFNELTDHYASKGQALSRISLQLLKEVLPKETGVPVVVWCDKHGGRNRYDDLLEDIADGRFIRRMEEGTERSRYRIDQLEICFQTRAEAHLPVAVSSMVCKYIRETSMQMFNNFWITHLPQLAETKGYPADAVRFRNEVEELRRKLQIDDLDFWRTR